jgi:alginate O-acetyltransferase complex protein AlgI
MLHGVFLTINQDWRLLRPRFWSDRASYDRIMRRVGFVLTFSAVVIALVLFRGSSIISAVSMFRALGGANGVWPYCVQFLRDSRVHPPWAMVTLFLPVAPIIWVIVLFFAVILLPNSLEILRTSKPALDFPNTSDVGGPGVGSIVGDDASFSRCWLSLQQLCSHSESSA